MPASIRDFIERAASVSRLGATGTERARIFAFYLVLAIKRAMRLSPAFARAKKLALAYRGMPFPFYLDRQLDFDVLRDTFVYEEYGAADVADPRTIFDLGSNVGATVIYFALRYPQARIVAFEPDQANAARFRRNTATFAARVTLYERAVYAQDDAELEFFTAPDLHWASSTVNRPGTHAAKVRTITLDTALRETGADRIDLLKFDIEGGEYDAFRQCSCLDRIGTIIGEIHPDVIPVTVAEFMRIFARFDIRTVKEGGNDIVLMRES